MRRRWVLGAAALGALAAAHCAYWYLPRPRAAALDPRSPVARWLVAGELPFAVWIPYPHQNLGALAAMLGGGDGVAEVAAGLAGWRRTPHVAFGPLVLPPASEMTVACDDAGERYLVAARVYPLVAAFARLAGRLAANPWLAGGVAEDAGRRVWIGWRGTVWTVSSQPLTEPPPWPAAPAPPPSLAVAVVRRAVGPFPAGRFLLVRRAGAVEVIADPPPPSGPSLQPPELSPGLALLLLSGDDGGAGRRGVALFAPAVASSHDLPSVASFFVAGGRGWPLPGGVLLELAGRRGARAGWEVVASDPRALEATEGLVERLGPWGSDAAGAAVRPRWGLWLDLAKGSREAGRLARMLADLPLTPQREVDRWRAASRVLTALAGRFSRLSVEVVEPTPGASELSARLEPRRRGAPEAAAGGD